MSPLRYQLLQGAAIREQLAALAALRITVFREWPYLYQGSEPYEQQYLETYARCPESLAVLVWDGEICIGATTALPLTAAEAAMREPFERAGLAVAHTLYFGESVVLPAYRGRGIGVAFFAHREAHARALGLQQCAFCAVDRPDTHPAKPSHYLGNDRFWQQRGYARRPELQCTFEWQDLDQTAPTPHRLTYWTKTL